MYQKKQVKKESPVCRREKEVNKELNKVSLYYKNKNPIKDKEKVWNSGVSYYNQSLVFAPISGLG